MRYYNTVYTVNTISAIYFNTSNTKNFGLVHRCTVEVGRQVWYNFNMKFLHLSDLHLGKRINEYSMCEEQADILKKIVDIAGRERPEAVIIAGDVYDKSVPSVEAVKLFDGFLQSIVALGAQVLVVSGNHDSAERLAFGGELLKREGVHISPAYDGALPPVEIADGAGKVNFYLLPFVKPAHVARVYPEEDIKSYTDALRVAIRRMNVDFSERNVLVTHQFVTGAERSESEELSVGGSDNVDGGVFDGFDYVALGHIHGPQSVGRAEVRYCGTPLKYSFSEVAHKKSVTVVEMDKKGVVMIRTLPLIPRRDWTALKGSYESVTSAAFRSAINCDNYIKITLTDEEDIPDGAARLRYFYPNLMQLTYDNARTRAGGEAGSAEEVESKSPAELFSELYEKQNGRAMSDEMADIVCSLIQKIWESEK